MLLSPIRSIPPVTRYGPPLDTVIIGFLSFWSWYSIPVKVSKKLVREGRVSPHHVITKSDWVSHEIQNAKDVEAVIELFRLQYNRLVESK
jgi:Family of unknown function (DUF5519)